MHRVKKIMSPISFLILFTFVFGVATSASADGLDRKSRIGVAEFRGQGFTAALHSWFEFPAADKSKLEVWGYTNRTSYAPGETVNLHVSTTAKQFDMIIVREGGKNEVVLEKKGITGKQYATPKDAYRTGPQWPVSQKLKIPADWKSGGYVVKLQVVDPKKNNGKVIEQQAFFIVRPGKTTNNKIAFVMATQTWQAYNDWGGSNCYEGVDGPERTKSSAISTQKPWARGQIWVEKGAPRQGFSAKLPIGSPPQYPQFDFAFSRGYSKYHGAAGWATYESHFARWAERNGYSMDYFAQNDLKGDVLKRYKAVVFIGHDEYHTMTDRKTIDNYIEQGGRLIRLAGNIIWHAALRDDTLVCYDANRRMDAAWESQKSGWPSVKTWGVNGFRGVYVKIGGFQPRATGGFTVYRPKHWALQGTDLYYGDVFGQESAIAAYEGDGLAYTFKYGLPFPTGEDGAPIDKIEIIAMALGTLAEEDHGNPGTNLYGGSGDLEIAAKSIYGSDSEENKAKLRYGSTMVVNMKKGKGEVFTAASVEWVNGLKDRNPFVEIITKNVLDRYMK